MWGKAKYYASMAADVAESITKDWEQWSGFLRTAARMYKYPYDEQLMIYAQRPQATACAEYNFWNQVMKRYVKKGATGIALIDSNGFYPRLRYVFDVADTGARENSRPVRLWQMKENYRYPLEAALGRDYGVKGGLETQIEKTAEILAKEYWQENRRKFFDIVEDSFLEEYDELNVEMSFRKAAAMSVTYQVYTRCTDDPDSYFEHQDFVDIFNFNTRQAANALGEAVNDIAGQMFREIVSITRNNEREKAKKQTIARRISERSNHEQANLHTDRGFPASQYSADRNRKTPSGQVWDDAPDILAGTQSYVVQRPGADREVISAPVGDSEYGRAENPANPRRTDEKESGTGQNDRTVSLGTAHEYTKGAGRGNRDHGTYQQLNFFLPAETEQISMIDAENHSKITAKDFSTDKLKHIEKSKNTENRKNTSAESQEPSAFSVPKKSIPTELLEESTQNFRITDKCLGIGGSKQKFARNIAAIRTLFQIESENRPATPKEQEILSQYVGWGGLSDAFDSNKESWNAEYTQLKILLPEAEYAAARASTLNAHYTSPVVINAIYDAIAQMGFQTGNILEPSMGIGNFFGLLPETMQNSQLYGVELDPITGRMAKLLYPQAKITISGFETTNRRDFYDLCVGNVPYGDYPVNDRLYNHLGFSIHNYFFAKSLDQVRSGGIVAFITSRYTMDAKSSDVRRYLAQRAKLLGAIRLPNNAFRANAGTDVVSDIIFLQKREYPVEIDEDWIHLGQNAEGFTVNRYFVNYPEMILGRLIEERTQYGKQECTVSPYPDKELADLLKEAVKHIGGRYEVMEVEEEFIGGIDHIADVKSIIPADPTVKNFSYTLIDGNVYFRENTVMKRMDLNDAAKGRVTGLVELQRIVNELITCQMEDYPDSDIQNKQIELNTAYDHFSEKYGIINSRANAHAFSEDSSYYLLCSLENVDEDGKFLGKADMFTKRTIRPNRRVEHVDTPSEALAVSIGEKGKVDLPFMSELLGKPGDFYSITDRLAGVIFNDPMGSGEPDLNWQTADEYLSGNVRDKLQAAQIAAQNDSHFQINVEALKKAQPRDLEAAEIDVRLGATWIGSGYIQKFMHETFETPYYMQRDIKVNYSPLTAEWRITGKSSLNRNDVAAYMTYGTDKMNAYKILEDTLNLRDVRIYDTVEDADGKQKRVLNKKETMLAQQKQQAIKDVFRDWIWKDAKRRSVLVARYNQMFNSTRPREYDGSHIQFVGMNPEIKLRSHQRNAIAHVLYGGNTLLAHEVGSGKTFEMVASAMESKRLGLCQKPMFVVPNHLTMQWANEFLRLYPSAKILVATRRDFEASRRKKFCARIATGDYDGVIIGHTQFEKIPISAKRQERLLQEQIDEITDALSELKYSRGENFTIKQMEKTRKTLQTRLNKLAAEEKKDDVITFEQLGVDKLFVDESQAYKNLFLYTKMRNVAGLSTSEAQRSSDMFMKCRYLDEVTGGRGIVFASGTPVSNSMTELYTVMRYLQHSTLTQKGLSHFDCWASTFGESTTSIELAPEGTGYRARTRFSTFFNLPELMNMFKEVADIKTSDQLNLPVPKAKFQTVLVQPSSLQKEMVQQLSARAAAVHSGLVDSSQDNMLCITSDGRKIGLDQRLMNPLLPDEPDSKINVCMENVLRIWEEGKEDKLTQLLFCDSSTPKMDGTFNVYDDIKDKLTAKGIPEEEIAFIHHADTEVKKKELFAKVRAGQVRILLGSTQKMGAGTNIQDRLVALHHLDVGWRPADMTQRNGRIIRQGNKNKQVQIFQYVTEGTFDAYLYQTLENKQKFISQIMTSKSPVRSCDDVDEQVLSFAEVKALCAGDKRIKEKMDLDIDVARLKVLKADHQNQQYRLEDKLLKYFPAEIEKQQELIQAYKKDRQLVEAYPLPEQGFIGMKIHGRNYAKKQEAGEMLLEACHLYKETETKPIGSYRGFQMELSFSLFSNEYILILKGEASHYVTLGADARGNLIRMDHALMNIPEKEKCVQEKLADLEKQKKAAKTESEKPFPQEAELAEKSARLAKLNIELNMENGLDTDSIANDLEPEENKDAGANEQNNKQSATDRTDNLRDKQPADNRIDRLENGKFSINKKSCLEGELFASRPSVIAELKEKTNQVMPLKKNILPREAVL